MLNKVKELELPAHTLTKSLVALKAIQQQSTIRSASWVRIFTKDDGLHIIGFGGSHLNMSFKLSDENYAGTDLMFDLLPAYNFLKKIDKNAQVRIYPFEDQVVFETDNLSFTTLSKPDDFWLWESIENSPTYTDQIFYEFEVGIEAFTSHLDDVSHAICKEDTRYYLCGVYTLPVDGVFTMVATDGNRLSRRCFEEEVNCGDWRGGIVSKLAVKYILKNMAKLKGTAKVRASADWFDIEVNGVRIISRMVDGTYPDYERVIPADLPIKTTINREQFIETLQPFIGKMYESLSLDYDSDKEGFIIQKRTEKEGTLKSFIPAKLNKSKYEESLKIGVEPAFLLGNLQALSAEEISINFSVSRTYLRDEHDQILASKEFTEEWDSGPMALKNEPSHKSDLNVEIVMPKRR